MKRSVLITTVILVACPPLPWTHTNAQAQTTDQHGWIGTETVKTRFGDFEFKNGYPTAEATDKLYELRTFYRAVESYLHFVTIMSMFDMQNGLNDFGLDSRVVQLIQRLKSPCKVQEDVDRGGYSQSSDGSIERHNCRHRQAAAFICR